MTHLFDPLAIRDITFANRVFVSPMCQCKLATSNPMNSRRVSEWRYVSSPNRNWRLKMSTVAGVIAFKAKQGEGSEVARLIAAALPHVERESGTRLWLVLHSNTDPDIVFLVDLFREAADCSIHMSGEAARQIFRQVRQWR